MIQAVARPETLKGYIMLRMDKSLGCYIQPEYSANNSASLLSASLEELQHQQLLLTMKNPHIQYEIFPIEWPIK